MILKWKSELGIVHEIKPELVVAGMDFGFTDPFVIEVAAKFDDTWLNFFEVYKEKMTIPEVLKATVQLTKMFGIERIWADKRDPKMIEYLQSHGCPVIPNQIDSLDFGLRTVYGLMKTPSQNKSFPGPRFRVAKERCPNLVHETQKYSRVVVKGDIRSGPPVDKNNHGLDATRYYMTGEGEIPPDDMSPSPLDKPPMYTNEKGQWIDNPIATMVQRASSRSKDQLEATWWDEQENVSDIEIVGMDDL